MASTGEVAAMARRVGRGPRLLAVALALAALQEHASYAEPPRAPSASAPSSATAPPASPEVRLLALGDSFTAGTGATPSQSFPARLAARWQSAGRRVTVRNLAVNGYTTDALLDEELPAAHGFAPTLVTLAIGANDLVRGSSPERYRDQLRRILLALRDEHIAPSLIVALPQPDWSRSPAAAGFGDPEQIAARIRLFNGVLREAVEAVVGRYLDLWPLMERQAAAHLVAPDGLHPSARAYDEWAADLATRLSPSRPASN